MKKTPITLLLSAALCCVSSTMIFAQEPSKATPPAEADVVRVPYISKTVHDQIRQEVEKNLQDEVIQAVMKRAEAERWGVPNAWPAWLQKIKLSGDVRVRAQFDKFSSGNSEQYVDTLAINQAGGIIPAEENAFINTTEDTQRLRLRARLGVDVAVDDNWNLGMRLASGSTNNPVSTNTTLGNDMANAALNLDRAFLNYQSANQVVEVWAGRFANPWLSTDLVWDDDLNFGGIATRVSPLREGFLKDDRVDPYLTLGVFPIEDIEKSSQDKWLYGAQTGVNFKLENSNVLKLAMAVYAYDNIRGQLNTFDSTLLDYTAPSYVQKGNVLFDIRYDADTDSQLAALASDYKELNFTLIYDIANFSPTHIVLIADFVHNFGFNAKKNLQAVELASGLDFSSTDVEENVDGRKLEVLVGTPIIVKARDWNVSVAYKHLEANAVLDAFTDSDFHLGGTDASGYTLKGQYGWANNVWSSFQLLSANEIDGAPLGVDVWQLDTQMRF